MHYLELSRYFYFISLNKSKTHFPFNDGFMDARMLLLFPRHSSYNLSYYAEVLTSYPTFQKQVDGNINLSGELKWCGLGGTISQWQRIFFFKKKALEVPNLFYPCECFWYPVSQNWWPCCLKLIGTGIIMRWAFGLSPSSQSVVVTGVVRLPSLLLGD